MTRRRSFSDKFKATVALEALRGDKTPHDLWRHQLLGIARKLSTASAKNLKTQVHPFLETMKGSVC
jgi:transposase-like protein